MNTTTGAQRTNKRQDAIWETYKKQQAEKTKLIHDSFLIKNRMLEIEALNIEYNQATDFGKNPNGKEAEIESLLKEWDLLKAERLKLKNN